MNIEWIMKKMRVNWERVGGEYAQNTHEALKELKT